MSHRIFISLAALTLTLATAGPVFAQNAPAVESVTAAAQNIVVPESETVPAPRVDSVNVPALRPYDEVVPRHTNAQPLSVSDDEATRRALKLYDELRSVERFSLKPQRVYGPFTDDDMERRSRRPSSSFDLKPRGASAEDFGDYDPYSTDHRGVDAARQISQYRQRTADRIADMISPGFGRTEFNVGDNHVRIDYIYAKRCKMRGLGICLQMTFK